MRMALLAPSDVSFPFSVLDASVLRFGCLCASTGVSKRERKYFTAYEIFCSPSVPPDVCSRVTPDKSSS